MPPPGLERVGKQRLEESVDFGGDRRDNFLARLARLVFGLNALTLCFQVGLTSGQPFCGGAGVGKRGQITRRR